MIEAGDRVKVLDTTEKDGQLFIGATGVVRSVTNRRLNDWYTADIDFDEPVHVGTWRVPGLLFHGVKLRPYSE